jgi:Icc-related predicted phosphoesterase
MPFWKKGKSEGEPTRIFYACDIHGSEPTYRKFLNAAKFYEVDALVFGGDLMGKLLIPIVREADGSYRASLQGQNHHIRGEEEMERFKRTLQTLGFYWQEMDPDEYRTYEGQQDRIDTLFDVLAKERLADWVALAEERLEGTGVRAYLCGGNDDTDEVLTALDEAPRDRVVNAENRVVPIDDEHVLVTVGYSTPTPWQTPRERTETEIADVIEKVVAGVPDPSRAVFNFHCPPLDSSLDTCLKLDASVWPPTPVIENRQPVYYGAGSLAVTDALRRYQPTVGLHGHIHESRGMNRYGRTPAFNPGSEYGEGVLRGLIVAIRGGEVVGQQFTSG